MKPLTLQDLLGPYAAEPWSPAELACGENTVRAWNSLGAAAEADGVLLPTNPATGTHISGTGNGGARPKGSKVGVPGSKHQLLLAIDIFDPQRALMRWVLSRGRVIAERLGCWFEHGQWTRAWLHLQIVPPRSGARFFLPYADLVKYPPTCAALPEQWAAAVPVFEYPAA